MGENAIDGGSLWVARSRGLAGLLMNWMMMTGRPDPECSSDVWDCDRTGLGDPLGEVTERRPID